MNTNDTAHAGETVNIPERAPHHFTNVSTADARMLTMLTPPGLEEFFALWGEPLPNRTAVPDPAQTGDRLQRGAALSPQYHNENL